MNNEKGVIILTSTGLSAKVIYQEVEKYFSRLPQRSVAIITTAAEGKEANKYSQLAKKQFADLGVTIVDFIDLEDNPQIDFSKYNIIYVCGGNTFKLLKHARETNFGDTVEKLLKSGGVYIGVSAGSIILTPTILIAESVDPEPNNVGLVNLTGLNIVNFEIHPHYDPAHDEELSVYRKVSNKEVFNISDSQAIVINKTGQEIVG